MAEWSHARFRLDERFVQLSLLVDMGEESPAGRWQEQKRRFGGLTQALDEIPDPALVLLGPPGSGKSTLLRHFELQAAIDGLRDPAGALTFYVSLNQFAPGLPDAPAPEPGVCGSRSKLTCVARMKWFTSTTMAGRSSERARMARETT